MGTAGRHPLRFHLRFAVWLAASLAGALLAGSARAQCQDHSDCDNGLFCDGAEVCDPVLDCQPGVPPLLDDSVGCTADSCDEVADVVVHAPQAELCSNGLFCDGEEICDPLLDCQAGTPPLLDDSVSCTADSCDEVADLVVHEPQAEVCSNGLFCDGAEVCDPVLDCQAGTPPLLDDSVGCTADSCDEVADVVVHTPQAELCSNGLFCDGDEICDPLLDCQAGIPPLLDDSVSCTADSCDEVADLVVHEPQAEVCSNGLFCDGAEVCDPVLDCLAGAPPLMDDAVGCTADSCDEVADVVVHSPQAELCSNGLFCDGAEICDPVLDCQAGAPPLLDDAVSCTADSCDEVADLVVHAPQAELCSNGLFCDGAEVCDPVLDCQAGAPPLLDDAVGCTADSCDDVADAVVHTPQAELCSNGLFCDGAEICDPVLDCQAGAPPLLDDAVGCTADSCDEVADVVVHAPQAELCSNGLFCDGSELCDPVLDCQAGAPPLLDDSVSCTADSCDEVADVVVHAPQAELCSNGLFCDGAEVCDPVLDCQAGAPPLLDDSVACTADSCDEVADVVVHAPQAELCSNGLFCDGAEVCDPVLDCQAGAPPLLDDAVSCTTDSCDEVADLVIHAPQAEVCSNGLFCDGAEVCDPLLDCQAGAPPLLDDSVSCTADACDEVADLVVHAPQAELCSNGLFCDGDEVCDPVLDCQAGVPPLLDDSVACTADSCDEVADLVVHAPQAELCSNGLFCDGAEICDPVLDCQAGTPPVLDDSVSCTADSCDEVADLVIHAPQAELCSNGLFCDGAEVCDPVLDCQAGAPPLLDDSVGCTADSCDEVADVVVHTPQAELCSNGLFCDGSELCDPVLDCQAGAPPLLDDSVSCTADSCDEVADVVVHTPQAELCSNGLFCDGAEICDPVLDCQAGTPPTLEDSVSCTADSCDEVADLVVHSPQAELCSNGLFCDGDEICDPLLDCQAGTPPLLDDSVSCTADSCDEVADLVVHEPQAEVCSNGLFCDGAEVCDPVLDCQAGAPPLMDDAVGCTADSCDEVADVVVHSPQAELCSNGLFCDGAEICDPVLDCQAGAPPLLDDAVSCTADSCDEVADLVVHAPQAELCSNGLFCDGDEICDPLLDCQAGTPPLLDDSVSCTADSCDEVADIVVHAPQAELCSNGLFCDGAEVCDPVLDCQAGAPPLLDDSVGCTADSCDEVADLVVHEPQAQVCSNSLFCDGAEICDPVLDCQAGTPPVLDDSVSCTADSCDEVADLVIHAPQAELCSNGLFCDGAEVCDPVLDCKEGSAPALDDAVGCTVDSCDEVADAVVHAPQAALCDNGLFCDGSEFCHPVLDCKAGAPPALDDGNPCTLDHCDEQSDVVLHDPGPFGLPGLQLPPEQIGAWGPLLEWPEQATHTAVLHTGKVLWWRGTVTQSLAPTYLWDPATGDLANTGTAAVGNTLCMGHSFLPDGRVIAMGGWSYSPSPGGGSGLAMLFDPIAEVWTRIRDMAFRRYYPSAVALANGRTLALAGLESFSGTYADIPEEYDPATDTWTQLPQAELYLGYYPFTFLLDDGRVLSTGPYPLTAALDPVTREWALLPPSGVEPGEEGSAVMYRPGVVLRFGAGDGVAEVFDAHAAQLGWRAIAPMNYERSRSHPVVLPTGDVFLAGGSTLGNNPACAVHEAAIWHTGSETWTRLASMQRPRIYHATAALLPDARILVAGGETLHPGEQNAEVYSPPYLFRGPRPTLTSAPSSASYGELVRVYTPQAAEIASVALMRPASVTHNFDQNASYVPIPFSAGPGFLDLSIPANPNLLPPGYGMLFLVDGDGVPSVAHFLQIGGDGDTDGDSIPDLVDNCPYTANGPAEAGDPATGDQTDTDADQLGDACDPDDDGDGLLDLHETGTGIFVSATDTGSDPRLADSDGDGFSDGVEVAAGWDPNDPGDPSPVAVPALPLPGLALAALLLAAAAARLGAARARPLSAARAEGRGSARR